MKLNEYLDKQIKQLDDEGFLLYDIDTIEESIRRTVYEEIKAVLESGEIDR